MMKDRLWVWYIGSDGVTLASDIILKMIAYFGLIVA